MTDESTMTDKSIMNKTLKAITLKIKNRSRETRQRYLKRIKIAAEKGPFQQSLPCGNLAHGIATCSTQDKSDLLEKKKSNIAIISSYNDMLSAHHPFDNMAKQLKESIHSAGAIAQFAGGVPAMCDGITQGEPGMELSLFSRDVIAMSTAIGLSHNMFDGALMLGVCDKIVPGLLIGALSFGHLPMIFIPAGPMTSGLPNLEKTRIRQLFAEGKAKRSELLEAESASYHSPGTCTFYGTANSNQMLMEIMGLHLPGSSFINPNTPLRDALTCHAAKQILKFTKEGNDYRPIGELVNEEAIINGIIGLLATGGSTNHTIHLVAIAKAAGIIINWDDFSELSEIIPLIAKIYPNGPADINHFHAAGGMAFIFNTLVENGLLHENLMGVATERSLSSYNTEPYLLSNQLQWKKASEKSLDTSILRPASEPFSNNGGLRVLTGNIGRAVIKTSAVNLNHRIIRAPAMVFDDQHSFNQAFRDNLLNKDFIAVIRFQGPMANGMPELHKLTAPMGVLQDKGFNVGLITDGRMSGASGKVPAAIHITPECAAGGLLAKIRNGDIIELNAEKKQLNVLVDIQELNQRIVSFNTNSHENIGMGRELFHNFRQNVSSAETGASTLGDLCSS